MIKADLAHIVHKTHGGISYEEAQYLVNLIIGTIKQRLAQGENVKLSGFGSLNLVQRKGRLGRNPQTGARVQLAPGKYVTYRASRLLGF